MGYSPWSRKESDTTEQLTLSLSHFIYNREKGKGHSVTPANGRAELLTGFWLTVAHLGGGGAHSQIRCLMGGSWRWGTPFSGTLWPMITYTWEALDLCGEGSRQPEGNSFLQLPRRTWSCLPCPALNPIPKVKWKSLSCVWLFVTPWTVAYQVPLWDSPGKITGGCWHFLLQGMFPTLGLNPGLLHCKQILYYLNHQGFEDPNPNLNPGP